MKTTTLATYERQSTLWKNANAFYRATDWVKMVCSFQDFSEEREGKNGVTYQVVDSRTGTDVTQNYFRDRYVITLYTKRGYPTCYRFDTREEANAFFKRLTADKVFSNFKKVNA